MTRAILALAIVAAATDFAINAAVQTQVMSPMQTFVLVFRQRPVQLTPAQLEQRAIDVKAWAQEQNALGRKLDPRALGEDGFYVGADGKTVPVATRKEDRLTAILFLEAKDVDDALAVAKSHPGLRYGVVSVEVRPWSSPIAQPAQR